MDFVTMARQKEKDIIRWRRALHRIPELGLDLPRTAAFVEGEVSALGLDWEKSPNHSGGIVKINGGKGKSTLAIRADMDGLPIQEETGLSFASEIEGNMHACGHDAHMAMALGAAAILKEIQDQIPGEVRFLFQPAEEGPGGALPMIEEGALEGVDRVMGLHVGGPHIEGYRPGQVVYGPRTASSDRFRVEVWGQGGHGANPHRGVDPIAIAASLVQEIQTLISREMPPVRPGVLTIGRIEGGRAFNVIPEKVILEGTARFAHEEERDKMAQRLEELCTQVARARRGDAKITYWKGYPPLVTDTEFTRFFVEQARDLLGEEWVQPMMEPLMTGEDMAYFLKECPGTFFYLMAWQDKDGTVYPTHHPRFDLDEGVMWRGAALHARTAWAWLTESGGEE